jgi:hypothetical protein
MSKPIVAPHMTPIERDLYEALHEEEYRGFRIVPKRDFGQYGYWSSEHRCNLNAGWVVCYGNCRICNAAPGATFAWTILGARNMIDDLISAGFEPELDLASIGNAPGDAQEFWRLNYARHGIEYPPQSTRVSA